MAFDGFFIKQLIIETNALIKHARIEKVSAPQEDKFLFICYRNQKRYRLLIDLNPKTYCFCLTDRLFDNHHTQFLSMLKKHLEQAILLDITQYKTDRTVIFTFEHADLLFGKVHTSLVFEAMGKHCNLILIKDGIIVDCYKKMFNESGRSLLPKAQFYFFESAKEPFDYINYESILSPCDLVDKYLGISPLLADYLFEHRTSLINIKTNPTKNLDNHKYYCFNLFSQANTKFYPTLSALLDDLESTSSTISKAEESFINKQLLKYQKKRELLLLNKDEAQHELIKKELADAIYAAGFDLHSYASEIAGYSLDITKTLNQNAQALYQKYQKAKRTITHIDKQLLILDEMIGKFHMLKDELLFNDSQSLINFRTELAVYGFKDNHKVIKKRPNQLNIKKIALPDSTIYIGKNSLENEYLLKEVAQKNDYWFHIKDGAGSHVILKTAILTETNIRLTAMVAAYYSKHRYSSSIAVDYTQVRNLKRIPKKPLYNLTYSRFSTIYIDIDEKLLERFN